MWALLLYQYILSIVIWVSVYIVFSDMTTIVLDDYILPILILELLVQDDYIFSDIGTQG